MQNLGDYQDEGIPVESLDPTTHKIRNVYLGRLWAILRQDRIFCVFFDLLLHINILARKILVRKMNFPW